MTHESAKGWWSPLARIPGVRVVWACVLGISLYLSVSAIFRGGYVGPDYNTHLARMLNSTRFFDFSMGDPPLYVLIGHGLFRWIGRSNAFPFTLAIIQAVINTLALWWFFLYTERRFKSPLLHLALVFFLTFLPVRLMHVVCMGTDWMTIPVFVLVLFLFDKFLAEKTSTALNAAFLGLALALGIWSKYSFMALLPAIFVIFVFLWRKHRWSMMQFVAICALSLILPSALVVHDYWRSSQVKDAASKVIWIPKGGAPSQPETTWRDLFSLKAADLQLFSAPEFFRRKEGDPYPFGFREAHRHSYLALWHMGVFTDTYNLFQDLPGPQSVDRFLIPDFKNRRAWKTPVMVASMSLGVLWTILALVGTAWLLFGAIRHLWRDRLEREDAAALLGFAYFLLMFLPIPFLYWSALTGSWAPRLTLVPQLCFFWAAFLLLDRTMAIKWTKAAYVFFALVIVQSGIEIAIMI